MKMFPSCHPRLSVKSPGFTLVEVCISLGIMAFSATAMLGLLPIGLGGMQNNMAAAQAINISQQVLLEAKQATFSSLLTNGGTVSAGTAYTYYRYFTDEGDSVTLPTGANPLNYPQITYTANVSVNPNGSTILPGSASAQPTLVTLTVEIRKTPTGVDAKTNPDVANIVSLVSCSDLSAYTANPN